VGLIKELTLLPLAPLRFTMWVGEKVAEEVDREQSSPQAHMQQLREIDEQRERGDLDEEQAAEAEAEIIEAETVIEPPRDEEQEEGQGG
jgi:cytochrome c-type biogenesis protein CcmH/NrfG